MTMPPSGGDAKASIRDAEGPSRPDPWIWIEGAAHGRKSLIHQLHFEQVIVAQVLLIG